MVLNHNITTPDKGTTNWHKPLNENFENIDTGLEIRDIEQKLEEYQPKPNAKYFATDSNSVWIGDGENWKEQSTFGKHPSFQSVDAEEINNKISVKPQENIEGISDALDKASEDQPVILSPGNYTGATSITIKKNRGRMIGAGKTSTVIKPDEGLSNPILTTDDRYSFWDIGHFNIDCSNLSDDEDAVDVDLSRTRIHNLRIKNSPRDSIRRRGGDDSITEYNQIVEPGRFGIFHEQPSSTIYANYLNPKGREAIYSKGWSNVISWNKIFDPKSGSSPMIYLEGSDESIVSQNRIEPKDSNITAIYAKDSGTDSYGVQIINNRIKEDHKHAVKVEAENHSINEYLISGNVSGLNGRTTPPVTHISAIDSGGGFDNCKQYGNLPAGEYDQARFDLENGWSVRPIFQLGTSQSISTTNQNYIDDAEFINFTTQWNSLKKLGEPVVRISASVQESNDSTAYLRLKNETTDNPILSSEISSNSNNEVQIGEWRNISLSSKAVHWTSQVKSGNGSKITWSAPTLYVGVR